MGLPWSWQPHRSTSLPSLPQNNKDCEIPEHKVYLKTREPRKDRWLGATCNGEADICPIYSSPRSDMTMGNIISLQLLHWCLHDIAGWSLIHSFFKIILKWRHNHSGPEGGLIGVVITRQTLQHTTYRIVYYTCMPWHICIVVARALLYRT